MSVLDHRQAKTISIIFCLALACAAICRGQQADEAGDLPKPEAENHPAEIHQAPPPAYRYGYYSYGDVGPACGAGTCDLCAACSAYAGCQRPCRRWFDYGGWLAQSFTANGSSPANHFNGPVTFNDRSNAYQMNQFWNYLERQTCTGGCGVDIGGRIDMLYGTDARFTQATGLDDDVVSNGASRFYKFALPQAYLEVAINNLRVKIGHFFTILGYESVAAPQNFFISRSYLFQYAQPITHTGVLATYDLGGGWVASSGFTRGWNNWEDTNENLDYLGGLGWTSCDKRTSAAFAITTGPQDPQGNSDRTVVTAVLTRKLNCCWSYVMQLDYGYENNAQAYNPANPAGSLLQDAQWYGCSNYLFYTINCCWSIGLRQTCFTDDDGVRVGSQRGAALTGPPSTFSFNPVPGHYNSLSIGANYIPNRHVTIRGETRWDWFGDLKGTYIPRGAAPFNDYNNKGQAIMSLDMILSW